MFEVIFKKIIMVINIYSFIFYQFVLPVCIVCYQPIGKKQLLTGPLLTYKVSVSRDPVMPCTCSPKATFVAHLVF